MLGKRIIAEGDSRAAERYESSNDHGTNDGQLHWVLRKTLFPRSGRGQARPRGDLFWAPAMTTADGAAVAGAVFTAIAVGAAWRRLALDSNPRVGGDR